MACPCSRRLQIAKNRHYAHHSPRNGEQTAQTVLEPFWNSERRLFDDDCSPLTTVCSLTFTVLNEAQFGFLPHGEEVRTTGKGTLHSHAKSG